MNQHAGPACALSVLIVGLFAVLLHDRGQHPPTQIPTARNSPDHGPDRLDPPAKIGVARTNLETQLASPSLIPVAKKVAEAPIETSSPPVSQVRSERTSPPNGPSTPPPVAPKPISDGEDTVKPSAVPPVRSTFTVVRSGEKLADVATRVYGSSDSTEQLWRANRDQVSQIDSVLARGTLLRTP
jgi:hypothetical protein